MSAASIKESLNFKGEGGVLAALGCSSCAFTNSTKQLLPCPSPARSSAWLEKLVGSSMWNSTACTSMRERGKEGTPRDARPPNSPSGTQATSCASQQAQRCHFSCPTTVTNCCHHKGFFPAVGQPTFPRSWNRGLL